MQLVWGNQEMWTKFWYGKHFQRDHFQDREEAGMIILRHILENFDVKMGGG